MPFVRPVSRARTSRTARETLKTASALGTRDGRAARAFFVDSSKAGMQTAADSEGCSGRRWERGRPFPVRVRLAVRPPCTQGATLSGWPSNDTARVSSSSSVRRRVPRRCAPAQRPATAAAAEEPRPRAKGMRLSERKSRRPGRRRGRTCRAAWTSRLLSPRGSVPAPSPAISTTAGPRPSISSRVSSLRRSRARPRQSNPGPRLLVEAGTETLTRARVFTA